jgi:LIM-domain binding protein
MMAQQVAMQQQANAQGQGGNNQQGQPNQMNPQQLQNMQAQALMNQQAHQQQQQQAAATSQQAQGQAQAQTQSQQAPPNTQAPSQQAQQAPQQQTGMQQQQQQQAQQQQQQAAAMLQQQAQQRQGEKLKGQCLMKLMQFGDHLANFGVSSKPLQAYMANGAQRLAAQASKQTDDLNYWLNFRDRFFSPKGVLRHSVWVVDDSSNKQYEIAFPALARYFHTHFESGIKNMQMIMEKGTEKELPNNGHYIESMKSSFVYWFDNGSQVRFSTQVCYTADQNS